MQESRELCPTSTSIFWTSFWKLRELRVGEQEKRGSEKAMAAFLCGVNAVGMSKITVGSQGHNFKGLWATNPPP